MVLAVLLAFWALARGFRGVAGFVAAAAFAPEPRFFCGVAALAERVLVPTLLEFAAAFVAELTAFDTVSSIIFLIAFMSIPGEAAGCARFAAFSPDVLATAPFGALIASSTFFAIEGRPLGRGPA